MDGSAQLDVILFYVDSRVSLGCVVYVYSAAVTGSVVSVIGQQESCRLPHSINVHLQ